MIGFVTRRWLMAKAALKAQGRLEHFTEDEAFYTAKVDTARYFAEQYLPPAAAQVHPITTAKDAVMAIPEEVL